MALRFTAALADPSLLRLPWSVPLEGWPEDDTVALPRGISRHVVRFVLVNDVVYAVKEAAQAAVEREFRLLRVLEREKEPAVRPVGVVVGRESDDGADLLPVLVTRHLPFSMPYRHLFCGPLTTDTNDRLLDALVLLLVRLHLAGFHWGDCSLSNVLFRRDATAFAAYLVDAETGEFHPEGLSNGQRLHDIEIARTNIGGELFDLAAGGLLHESVDPIRTSDDVEARYLRLWDELYAPERVPADEPHRLEARVRRLHDLGFDVEEVELLTDAEGTWFDFKPRVVEPDHHHRRMLALTGLEVQENHARVLLRDLASFRLAHGVAGANEQIVAHRWLAEAFEPVVAAVPPELRRKLEPAELYHQVLEHRWYLSEAAGAEVPLLDAVVSFLQRVLADRPDEEALLTVGPLDGDDDSLDSSTRPGDGFPPGG